MSIPGKLLIALLCAAAASALWTQLNAALSFVQLLAPSAAAAVLAVVLSHRALPVPSAFTSTADQPETGNKGKSPNKNAKKAPPSNKKAAKAPKAEKSGKSSGAKRNGGAKESGTVKWFNGTKGFGFIVRESGEEIFVHHRSIEGEGRRNLRDGAPVRFRVVDTDKGPQAEDVEAVSG